MKHVKMGEKTDIALRAKSQLSDKNYRSGDGEKFRHHVEKINRKDSAEPVLNGFLKNVI
jgi:hypothetical protein